MSDVDYTSDLPSTNSETHQFKNPPFFDMTNVNCKIDCINRICEIHKFQFQARNSKFAWT
jgi:hypothetical protein